MTMTPSERSLRARIGAHTLHATHDSKQLTAPGRKAFLDRFETQVDPERVLSPEERAERAHHALQAHMARLALRSAQARRKKSVR